MTDQPDNDPNEPSDLLKFDKPQSPPIAPVDKVVGTAEERRQRTVRMLVLASIGLLSIVVVVVLVRRVAYKANFRSAVTAVGDEGRPAKIERALEFAEEGSHDELRARLLARAGLGGDLDKLDEAKKILEAQPLAKHPDLRIARVYVMLAEGRPGDALAEAQKSGEFGSQANEFLRARALTLIANGQWSAALNDAQTALELREDSAQPAALVALTTGKLRGPERGLVTLEGFPSSIRESEPARIVQARLEAARGQFDASAELAEELLESDALTAAERAWAEVLLARAQYERGQVRQARRNLSEAATLELRGDELLILALGQLALSLDESALAEVVLKRLGPGPSADLDARAHTIAWWLASTERPALAVKTITDAGFGEDAATMSALGAFSLGRAKEQSNQSSDRQQARALYARAAESTNWRLDAYRRRIALELSQGKVEAAIQQAQKSLAQYPSHPVLVELAVQAYVAADQKPTALEVATASAAAFEDQPLALATLAQAQRENGDARAAYESLGMATEIDPTRARWHALRGEAAYDSKQASQALDSYEKALDLDPDNPLGLVGMLMIHLDADDLAAAGETLEQIDRAGVFTSRLDDERARYLVRTGAGSEGISAVRSALGRNKDNASLHLLLARLYLQSEQYNRAAVYFERARRVGADPRRAYVAAALAHAYSKKFKSAEKSIESAANIAPQQPDAQLDAWLGVIRARQELAEDRTFAAAMHAAIAAELAPADADVQLVQADIAEARNQEALPDLRAAANAKIPMPLAAGRVALKVQATTEGCAMAERYLRASPRGSIASSVRDLAKSCK